MKKWPQNPPHFRLKYTKVRFDFLEFYHEYTTNTYQYDYPLSYADSL